jgi:ribosomal protein L44E
MTNPFKPNTTSYYDWEVMKDLKWHCTKCELKSAQAKTWQVWRQRGIQLDTDEKGNFYKRMYCPTCDMMTVHRKLKSIEILDDTKIRSGIPARLSKKIKEILSYEEAVFLRKMLSNLLEIDHKFPQIRWCKDEKENKVTMNEKEIKKKFMLLTRSNNLLKSRFCERCVKEGKRGHFPGIYFWYEGNENWRGDSECDEKGCIGCFWYDPYKWREELNKIVNKKNK